MTVASAGQRLRRRPAQALVVAAVALLVGALDQWSKTWAVDHLSPGEPRHVLGPVNLVLTYNRGAAFSIGSGLGPTVEVVAVLVVLAVVLSTGLLARRGAPVAVLVGSGLMTGGALSNLADRFVRHLHGAVVDFVQAVSWWPVFNLADASVTIGTGLVLVTMVRPGAKAERRPRSSVRQSHAGPP